MKISNSILFRTECKFDDYYQCMVVEFLIAAHFDVDCSNSSLIPMRRVCRCQSWNLDPNISCPTSDSLNEITVMASDSCSLRRILLVAKVLSGVQQSHKRMWDSSYTYRCAPKQGERVSAGSKWIFCTRRTNGKLSITR